MRRSTWAHRHDDIFERLPLELLSLSYFFPVYYACLLNNSDPVIFFICISTYPWFRMATILIKGG